MRGIPEEEVVTRIRLENPWWESPHQIDQAISAKKPRAYLDPFFHLLRQTDVHRAIVLMGPRRVGKTWMAHHAIQNLIGSGVDPKKICYISIESPVYSGRSLDRLVEQYARIFSLPNLRGCYIIFDEVQYLQNWEVHLKRLVDDNKDTRFVASGSAAAALKLKSAESGAGRFTDFHLPPLTFFEYLEMSGKDSLVAISENANLWGHRFKARDIGELNSEFIHYLNFGGYPEAVFSQTIQDDPGRFIRSDIIDKVLLKDLPGLYGIENIQELNRLFTMLAYNTGSEISLADLSTDSGVTINTIKKYLEYLEAAFLIRIIHRIDYSAARFKKADFFKVYLTNPSMRCALWGPVAEDHKFMGHMTETAIISQWLHSDTFRQLHYARWKKYGKIKTAGEVDIVYLSAGKPTPSWCIEVKWSDRFFDHPDELTGLVDFCNRHKLESTRDNKPPHAITHTPALCTTINHRGVKTVGDVDITFSEASIYCYTVGKNTISMRKQLV